MKKVLDVIFDYILPIALILTTVLVFLQSSRSGFYNFTYLIAGVLFGGLLIYQSLKERNKAKKVLKLSFEASVSDSKDNGNLGQTLPLKSNSEVLVKIKKLIPEAIIPTYAKDGDAGLDLIAISETFNGEFLYKEFGTGLSVEIPKGYVGLIFPRSSISDKSFALSNAVGVIDSGYRGELKVRFKVDGNVSGKFILDSAPFASAEFRNYQIRPYRAGDKVAQLVILPYPQVTFEESSELSQTERGEGGYGHTGN